MLKNEKLHEIAKEIADYVDDRQSGFYLTVNIYTTNAFFVRIPTERLADAKFIIYRHLPHASVKFELAGSSCGVEIYFVLINTNAGR
jgi:hypothetical protein